MNFSDVSGGGTYEVMFYPTQAGTVTASYPLLKSGLNGGTNSEHAIGNFINLNDTRIFYPGIDTNRDSDAQTSTKKYYMHEMYYFLGYLVNINGVGYFPILDCVLIQETRWYDVMLRSNLEIQTTAKAVYYTNADGVPVMLNVGTWHYLAVSGGQAYVNGLSAGGASGSSDISGLALYMPAYGNYSMIDEFRVSSGTLFGGAYTPSSIPYDTNKVMVLPGTANSGDIAVKTNVAVGEMRVGGARPTYPTIGDVFIAVEKESDDIHTVTAAQQYQAGGWDV